MGEIGYEAEPADAEAIVQAVLADASEGWPGDPGAQYVALTSSLVLYRAVASRLGVERAALIARMNAGGQSYAEIAGATGLTRARVQQLAQEGRKERARSACPQNAPRYPASWRGP